MGERCCSAQPVHGSRRESRNGCGGDVGIIRLGPARPARHGSGASGRRSVRRGPRSCRPRRAARFRRRRWALHRKNPIFTIDFFVVVVEGRVRREVVHPPSQLPYAGVPVVLRSCSPAPRRGGSCEPGRSRRVRVSARGGHRPPPEQSFAPAPVSLLRVYEALQRLEGATAPSPLAARTAPRDPIGSGTQSRPRVASASNDGWRPCGRRSGACGNTCCSTPTNICGREVMVWDAAVRSETTARATLRARRA